MVMKLDLSKAYDKVYWTFIRLALIQVGFNLNLVNWIMGCIESSSSVLINEAPSTSFKSSRGLRQGFLLSPFIFLLVVEGLSRIINYARRRGIIKGLKISQKEILSHFLFIDDVIMFSTGFSQEFKAWKDAIDSFCTRTIMEINIFKSIMITNKLNMQEKMHLHDLFRYAYKNIDEEMKYLDFILKPNSYHFKD
jgi:hypothetical protein